MVRPGGREYDRKPKEGRVGGSSLRLCYAMSGTGLAYRTHNLNVRYWPVRSVFSEQGYHPYSLLSDIRTQTGLATTFGYAMSGTDVSHSTTPYWVCDVRYSCRLCGYALATRSPASAGDAHSRLHEIMQVHHVRLCHYILAMRCPVLRYAMRLPGSESGGGGGGEGGAEEGV
eukprot:1885436-Rhodomonas_salina.1